MRISSFYSGWHVLAGSFVCAALAIGFSTYIFGMFTLPVTEEFGISRATYNNGMIGLLLGNGIASVVLGRLLDRVSARLIMAASAVAYGGALITISQTDSLVLMLLMITFPLAFGTSGCGSLAANTVVVRWFKRRRGRALGILALSTSVGGFISQPLTAFLIDTYGWRPTVFLIGLVPMIVFLLVAAFVLRNQPEISMIGYRTEFGDPTDGTDGDDANLATRDVPERTWSAAQLVRSRNFWLVAIGIGILFGVDQAVLVSQVPYFQDAGYDLKIVGLLVAVKTISAIGGKLLVGFLADKVDLRWVFAYVAGCNATLLTVYILQPPFWVLLGAVALLGIAVGGVYPAWSTILAWLFGARSYGTVMGLMAIVMQPFAMFVMRFVGEVHDHTGSYAPAFAVFIGMGLVAMALISQVRPPSDDSPTADSDETTTPPTTKAAEA